MSIHLKGIVFFFCILNFGLGCCLGTRVNAQDPETTFIYYMAGIWSDYRSRDVSGIVSQNGIGLKGVTIYGQFTSSEPSPWAETDAQGFYKIRKVGDDKSWYLTPIKSGYQFNPQVHEIPGDGKDYKNKDFIAQMDFREISGKVVLSNGGGLAKVKIIAKSGVWMDNDVEVGETDTLGNYKITGYGDGDILTPKKIGYQFDPPVKYILLEDNHVNQNFTAYKHTISGKILENGKGLKNVEIYDGKKLLVKTNSDGYYETEENAGIDFTLTAQLTGYEFKPPDIPIVGSQYLHENKDFTATKLAPLVNISGKVVWFKTPNSYTAAMEAYAEDGSLYSRTATDVDGNYSIPVPVGWTGTVKPFSLGFYFSPEKVYYSSLKENKIQNYTVMPPFSWTGNVIFEYAWKCVNPILPALTIKAYDLDGKLISTVVTGSDGIVNFALPYYWSGWVTAVSPGYTISPSRVDGHGWTVDHHQDFYIQNYNCTPE